MKKRAFILVRNYPNSGLNINDVIVFNNTDYIEIEVPIPREAKDLGSIIKSYSNFTLSEVELYPEHWKELNILNNGDI